MIQETPFGIEYIHMDVLYVSREETVALRVNIFFT